MTAINVLVLPDRALMISDGAAYVDGKIVHRYHKVTALPHINAAIGIRGMRMVSTIVIDAISAGARSYDDLRARIVDLVRATFEPVAPIWQSKYGPDILDCEIIVAGWSESRGPAGFILATSDTNAAYGFPAWTVVDIPAAFFSPDNGELAGKFACPDFDDAMAIELIERQSAMRSNVGEFCQLTTVRQHGIEPRVLKNWKAV